MWIAFLSMKRIKITSFNNCFEQKNIYGDVFQTQSVVQKPEGVSLNTSNLGRGDKMNIYDPDRAI